MAKFLRIGNEIINLDNVMCIRFYHKEIHVQFAVIGRSGPDPTEPFEAEESLPASGRRSPIPRPRVELSEWRDFFPYTSVFAGDDAITLRKWLKKNAPGI